MMHTTATCTITIIFLIIILKTLTMSLVAYWTVNGSNTILLCYIFLWNLHFYVFHSIAKCMVLWYYCILELTTIFADDNDIQGDSLPEFIG